MTLLYVFNPADTIAPVKLFCKFKNLTQIITFQNAIVNAKMLIVKKLNRVRSIGTFIKTSNGFKVSNPEGYVAIDRVSGDAVKLVDRMEFSYNNFTAIKAWDK